MAKIKIDIAINFYDVEIDIDVNSIEEFYKKYPTKEKQIDFIDSQLNVCDATSFMDIGIYKIKGGDTK